MTMTRTASKPDRFAREYEMIVSRRMKLRGFGLDERVYVGLWTDESGKRRRTELCRLGCHFTLDGALAAAGEGMARHPTGTREHGWHAEWAARLQATVRAMLACDTRYRRLVRELSGDVPMYGGDAVAVAAE